MATPNAGVDQTGPQQVAPSLPSWNTETQQGDVRIRISWRHTQNGAVTIKVGRQENSNRRTNPNQPAHPDTQHKNACELTHSNTQTRTQRRKYFPSMQLYKLVTGFYRPVNRPGSPQNNSQTHKCINTHTQSCKHARTPLPPQTDGHANAHTITPETQSCAETVNGNNLLYSVCYAATKSQLKTQLKTTLPFSSHGPNS